MTFLNKRLGVILLSVSLLLLIPLIAGQFTDEVNWSPLDFLIMGGLLLITGLVIELFLRKVKNRTNRIVAVFSVLVVFFLIWAELAVGIFGTPFAGS